MKTTRLDIQEVIDELKAKASVCRKLVEMNEAHPAPNSPSSSARCDGKREAYEHAAQLVSRLLQ